MDLEKIKTAVSDTVASMVDTMKDSLSSLRDMKETSLEKLTSLVDDILGLAPLIETTGFSMKDVSVDAGIPPAIIITFLKKKDVSPEVIEKLLEDNKDKNVFALIVQGLQKADAMQKGMHLTNYKFTDLKMKLGLPPDVSLKFTRIEKGTVL